MVEADSTSCTTRCLITLSKYEARRGREVLLLGTLSESSSSQEPPSDCSLKQRQGGEIPRLARVRI
ncbi:hypothetical protein E2C01_047377 [Portunus trituberculatus]|uniref:Uncharacterized protein n=1 Tax=Portunus trituberculatus TaxID=210409 RepID=A0A5B7G8D1_PORTR|nr:hypothetical protein [Portunus trituberculatus]